MKLGNKTTIQKFIETRKDVETPDSIRNTKTESKNRFETNALQGRPHLQSESGRGTEGISGGIRPRESLLKIKRERLLRENIKKCNEECKVCKFHGLRINQSIRRKTQ